MKYIKLFEEKSKIEIFTGSHSSNSERNREAFKKLNSLLLSKENPFQDYFQTEYLYLDDTDGLISIVHSSHLDDHISFEEAKKINGFIRSKIEYNDEIIVYIGDLVFRK